MLQAENWVCRECGGLPCVVIVQSIVGGNPTTFGNRFKKMCLCEDGKPKWKNHETTLSNKYPPSFDLKYRGMKT